jgi:Fe-S-cluster containining protein
MTQIQECKRCGNCCKKGGPSLHPEDKSLLTDGFIKHYHLITIRKGELVLGLLDDDPEPTAQEMVKIGGKGKDWACIFFDGQNNSCSIYEHRPLECRLLQCSETSALEEIAGHNTISRIDLIPSNHPIMGFILNHEKQCPIPDQERFHAAASRSPESEEALAELTKLVRKDLDIRSDAADQFDMPLPLELFLFGRPIHTLLAAYGLAATEISGNITITRMNP